MTDDGYVFSFLTVLLPWFMFSSTRKPLEYRRDDVWHRERIDRCNIHIAKENAAASILMTLMSLGIVAFYTYGKATGAIA